MDTTPVHVNENVVRERVRKIQENSKQYTDRKKTSFNPGDQGRIRKPWKVKKGEQKFTKPRTVGRKKSPYTYLLDDGRIWNTSHLSVLPEINIMDNDTEQTEPQRDKCGQ